MNIEKHLILIKGEDKTEEISSCEYENGKWQVGFGRGKRYAYNYSNVQWLKDPVSLNPLTTVVYQNNHPISGINKILDFEEYIRTCFVTGYKKVFSRHEVTLEQSCLTNPNAKTVFKYLKQLSEKVGVLNEDEDSFLSKQYDELANYIATSSVLSKYLDPEILNNPYQRQQIPIFPFGFNLSQKAATEKAVSEQLSIIEGPPGTGKTQTILNVIANAIINGKTVAVVSNNNSATVNVLEKLQKYDVDFVAAYLGNKENKEKFFAEQTRSYPDMSNWVLDIKDYNALKKNLEISGKKIEEMLEAKNKVAILKQKLSAFSVEREYFNNYYNETEGQVIPYHSLTTHNSAVVMKLWIDYQLMAERNKNAPLLYKLKNLLNYGIISFSFYKNSNEQVIAFLQRLYYEKRANELDEEILALTGMLETYQFDKAIVEYSDNSMKLFKAKLAERFSKNKERRFFAKGSLRKEFDSFIKDYPIILSTTHSLRTCASSNYLFDYVIIDEASQVDIVTGTLALSSARNAVIVGDLKQLPNVVPGNTATETNAIFNRFALSPAYNYEENSILSSITTVFQNVPKTLLREHYRCHPKIIGFCNQKFYNNELIVLTEENGREKPLIVYKTAKGNHARGKYNQRQIDVIMNEVIPEQIGDSTTESVGIISPYRLQRDKVKETIGDETFEVDTVHKYQGREKDVIILTTVVNESNDFVDNPNLLNVAISRAVDKLILVVSDNESNNNSNIGDLVRYVDYNNFEVINSSIYSVFDLLYQSYIEQLLATRRVRKRVSKYESENLMNAVIEKVLDFQEFNSLDYVMHQPLKMLIRNPEKLNEKECRFAMNILTHTDFLIFNKMDKMPVLVLEVDGYAFHNNPAQIERDRMKDTILQKYEIPILRIKTNESGEERRLRNNLIEILK